VKKATYADIESPNSRAIGGITITKVIREHLPLKTDPNGSFKTIGQLLDENLHSRLQEGEQIQDIAFHFDTEDHESYQVLKRMYGLIPQFED